SVGAGRRGALTPPGVAEGHDRGYYSLLYLAQALGASGWSQALQLKVLASEVHQVLRGDVAHPERSTTLGLVKVIPQEYHNVTCSLIDVDSPDAPTWGEGGALDSLLVELRSTAPGSVVALRQQQRFVQGWEKVRVPAPEGRSPRVREGGVYLITGGLGGVMFVLGAYLAHVAKAKLVLTGRARLPERAGWADWRQSHGDADPISQRILRVQALEDLGAEVLTVSADVGDAAQMEEAFRQAEACFGAVHGVIHGAGIVAGNTFRPLQDVGQAECEEQFHPKVAGLLALDRALQGRDLDFCLLTSSLSSVLGGFAYGAYAAANIFMDAYAAAHNQKPGPRWLSVNWDEWRLTENSAEVGERAGGLAQFAMSGLEGAGAFARVLEVKGVSQLVVSTGDLQARIDQWIRLEALREGRGAKAKAQEASRHPRPHLQNAYVAPGNPTEQKIARIWAELLGVEKVGIQDNFFDLGGHSLLAIQVVTRMKADLDAEVSMATLFEGPTVESLSRLIGRENSEPEGFEHSSDRGRKRKEERQRRQAERVEGTT
ncbi:MAG TPA: SDR family NAD(P)-dependent oxidoreductase, partial [Vicinamibacteria bacterium]|nr:SDR family NAD(P)-dependent oxidoreductase [Vicinamibacteria bacterium]